jgi:hypothetical protein
MSAHLQFGPEWMRRGPGKSGNPNGASATGEISVSTQDQSNLPSQPSSIAGSNTSSKGSVAVGSNRRHPSLGNLSFANSIGTAPLGSSATTPSPGVFSFAAAAQAGSVLSGGGGPNLPASSSASSALPHSSEGDSVRYSKRLLSLYSSERGGKAPSPTSQEGQLPTSPRPAQVKKVSREVSSGGNI